MEAKIIRNRVEPWISDGWNYATSIEPRLLPLADAAIDDARLTSDETYSATYFHLLHLYETAQREGRRRG